MCTMLTNEIDTILQGLDITASESKLYRVLLENHHSNATQLASLLGLPRTSVYHTISSLLANGFLIEVQSKGTKTYNPVPMKALLQRAKQNINKARETEKQIKKMVDLFGYKTNYPTDRKNVEVLYGLQGAWYLLENVLYYRKDSYWIAGTHTPFNKIITEKDYFQRITHRRKRMKKTMSYVIADSSSFSQKLVNQDEVDFRQVKILPKPTILGGTVIVYGNKLGMISYGNELKTVIIEDARLAEILRLFHRLAWKSLL